MSSNHTVSLETKLDGILRRHDELAQQMATVSGEAYMALAQEFAEIDAIAGRIQALRATRQEARGLREMLADRELDTDMRTLAREELEAIEARLPELEREVGLALVPADEAGAKGAILEIRAGTGGEEAALFAGDLYRMYQRYAELRGWRFEPISVSDTGLGGVKEVVVAIKGQGVFARLKYEAGVHRVQRVPVTEASGRIHTSAATVAVRPRRPVGQHHRQRGAHHASADRHRGHAAGREVAAQEPRQGDARAACAAVRSRARSPRRRARSGP
jgi:peptide chain release factor 1